jgi:hypothetical protein
MLSNLATLFIEDKEKKEDVKGFYLLSVGPIRRHTFYLFENLLQGPLFTYTSCKGEKCIVKGRF